MKKWFLRSSESRQQVKITLKEELMENNLETACSVSFGMRGRVEIEEGDAVGDKKSHSYSLETSKQVQFRETNRVKSDQEYLERRGRLSSWRS